MILLKCRSDHANFGGDTLLIISYCYQDKPSNSFLWYPVSSFISSLACLSSFIILHSPCISIALSQRYCAFALLCFFTPTLSDFTFFPLKTRFSCSLLWTPGQFCMSSSQHLSHHTEPCFQKQFVFFKII